MKVTYSATEKGKKQLASGEMKKESQITQILAATARSPKTVEELADGIKSKSKNVVSCTAWYVNKLKKDGLVEANRELVADQEKAPKAKKERKPRAKKAAKSAGSL